MEAYVTTKAEQALFNGLPGSIVPQSNTLGTQLAHRKVAIRGSYKFSRDGGAVSTISLKDENGVAITLPAGLIITYGLIVAGASPIVSGGTPTFDIGIAGGAEFKSGLAYSAVDGANEATLAVPVPATASTAVITTAGLLTLKVITAAITAGDLDVFLEGFYRE